MKVIDLATYELIRKFEQTYWEDKSSRNRLGEEIFDKMGLHLINCDYTVNEIPIKVDETGECFWLKVKFEKDHPIINFMFVLNPM